MDLPECVESSPTTTINSIILSWLVRFSPNDGVDQPPLTNKPYTLYPRKQNHFFLPAH